MTDPFDRLPQPILIVGGYGYRNLGDEAILAGMLARIGPRDVTVVSRNPAETTRLHGVPAVAIGRAARALMFHRSVVLGGGGLFGRDMGRFGRLLPAFGLVASALGRPVLIAGVDVDDRLAASARMLLPQLMRVAQEVVVRDQRSVAILAEWGVSARLEPDLSAWMPASADVVGRRLLHEAGVDRRRKVVGLALTGVRAALVRPALDAVDAAMDAMPEVQFCFVPMSRHPRVARHDDLRLARRLQAAQPRLIILDGDHHPADVLAAIGQLSALVSMRYHGILFADRASVPLVPLVYAEKTRRWLDERGVPAIPLQAGPLTAALRAALGRASAAAGARMAS